MMRSCLTIIAALLAALSSADAETSECRRIISLAPSITETVFALGLGDNLAGVTPFCVHPPAARSKPRVGALYDLNYEAVLIASPSIVFILDDDQAQQKNLSRLGLPFQTLSQRNLASIMKSIAVIGERCGVKGAADELLSRLTRDTKAIGDRTRGLPKKRVLIAVGRSDTSPISRNIFISGQDGFYGDLLEIAGGENVFKGTTSAIGSISPEGLLALNPQVILEIIPGFPDRRWREEDIKASWKTLDYVPAVKNGEIHVIEGDYAVVPGPRIIELLRKLAELIHPEVFR